MKRYLAIFLVVALIFVAALGYVVYDMFKPKCAANQQYTTCGDGSTKACYPICADNEQVVCDDYACGPICNDPDVLYGPNTDTPCSEYTCGPLCDAQAGEVFNCNTQKCEKQCSGSKPYPFVCPDGSIDCMPDKECPEGLEWDCTKHVCVNAGSATFYCDPTGNDIPTITTTTTCTASDKCCYQNSEAANACFQTPNTYWFGRSIDDDGNLENVDLSAVVVNRSKYKDIPLQGDSGFNATLTWCSSDDSVANSSVGVRTSRRAVPRPYTATALRLESSCCDYSLSGMAAAVSDTATDGKVTGSPCYCFYGLNYTDKYIWVSSIDNGTYVIRPTKQGDPPITIFHSSNYKQITIVRVGVSDTQDGEVTWYEKNAIALGSFTGHVSDVTTQLWLEDNDMIVFQRVGCITSLPDLANATACN